ncbi:MAG: hypothetical protein Q4B50_07360 [Bacillota bacterium]|nr:hypothetical protein [Bacillota bacterium]
MSEICPNLLPELEDGNGQSLSYSPGLSMMDGSLGSGAKVYDFTPYDFFRGSDVELASPPACGTWFAQHWDSGEKFISCVRS